MQLCSVIVVWNCGDCCNHPLGLQHLKLPVAVKSLRELKFCPFHFRRFLSFLALTARLLFQTVFWMFFLPGKSTRKQRKQTLSCTTCCLSTGSDGTPRGRSLLQFSCPYRYAGGVGGIIRLLSLMWRVLSWVRKRSSELICVLRLQTNQWLLPKGVIYILVAH